MMNIKQFEKCLEKNIKKAKKNGYEIRAMMFAQPNVKVCCPIGAVLVGENVFEDFYSAAMDMHTMEFLAKLFQIDAKYVRSFINGFDGAPFAENPKHWSKSYHKLGQKFRKKYLQND